MYDWMSRESSSQNIANRNLPWQNKSPKHPARSFRIVSDKNMRNPALFLLQNPGGVLQSRPQHSIFHRQPSNTNHLPCRNGIVQEREIMSHVTYPIHNSYIMQVHAILQCSFKFALILWVLFFYIFPTLWEHVASNLLKVSPSATCWAGCFYGNFVYHSNIIWPNKNVQKRSTFLRISQEFQVFCCARRWGFSSFYTRLQKLEDHPI